MVESAADTMLESLRKVDGYLLGCMVDASTGMVVAADQDESSPDLPETAEGAVGIARILTLLAGYLALDDGLEDVMVTFTGHFHLLRQVGADSGRQILLLVVLDRHRANLAAARREIRAFCENLTS